MILGVIGFSSIQDAFAVGGTISDQASCVAAGGSWNPPNLCVIPNITINAGETLVVSSGIKLTIFGNSVNQGTIDNFGTLEIQGSFFNLTTINNFGTLQTIFTTNFTNFGTIILFSSGLIRGEGGIDNDVGGTIIGGPTLTCGAGTTPVGDVCEADVTQAQLDAALAQRDAALADLNNLFTNNSCFPLAGTIQEVLDCIDALMADLATALGDLDAANTRIAELEAQLEEVGLPGPPVSNQGQGKGVPAQGKNKP